MSEHSFIVHEIKGYISSLFLVEENNRFFLLDAGCSCDFYKIKRFFEKNGKHLSSLKLVVVTHMHPDHAGGVRHFKKLGIPVASTEGAYKWYRGIGGFIQHKIDTYLAKFSAKRKGNIIEDVRYDSFFQPDFLLKDNDSLPFFPDWKAIKTPGHTFYDISVYNEEKKIVYLADLVLMLDGKFVLPFPVLFPKLMRKSLEKVADLNLKKILLAHGGMIENGENGIDFRKVILDLKENLGGKIRKEFRLLYPFCVFPHDKLFCVFKKGCE